MSNKVEIGNLSKEIQRKLSEYNQEVFDTLDKIGDEVSDDLVTNTKNDANVKSGKYRRNIKKKKESTLFESKYIWYVAKPSYRLSHLLENGHVTRNGGRTKANHFISNNERKAIQDYERKIKEELSND